MGSYDHFSKKTRRLQSYDYRGEGLYFITICTRDRLPHFGQVVAGEMQLSAEGRIAFNCWQNIPHHYPQVFLGPFIVMPNHVHGILGIETLAVSPAPSIVATLHCKDVVPVQPEVLPKVQQREDSSSQHPKNQHMANISPKAGSISRIISAYKGACTSLIRRHVLAMQGRYENPAFAWQPRFHDHIIRSKESLKRIEDYILSNPEKWKEDGFFI